MSKPSAGKYYIVNRETTTDGTSLAINYSGENTVLTVTELGSQPTQVWVITNYSDSDMQAISPQDATSLQVHFKGSDNLTVAPAAGYSWNIRGDNGLYTIQNGDFTVFWGLQEAAVGQAVYCSAGDNDAKQNWNLIAA